MGSFSRSAVPAESTGAGALDAGAAIWHLP
jgi:hypothetical protein